MRQIITFDCYGTLVDFALTGATLDALSDRLPMDGVDTAAFIDNFRVMRFQAVLGSYRPYTEVLRLSLENAMRLHGIPYSSSDGDAVIAAVPDFGPFSEVPHVLTRLKFRYELAIVSNSDDQLMEQNVANIGVDFDHVVTSEQAKTYKPQWEMFQYAYRVMDVAPEQVVHVAQGWEYDLIPTRDLGLRRRVWINRNAHPGSSVYQPYDELMDMASLPDLLLNDPL